MMARQFPYMVIFFVRVRVSKPQSARWLFSYLCSFTNGKSEPARRNNTKYVNPLSAKISQNDLMWARLVFWLNRPLSLFNFTHLWFCFKT